tara:strand:+ start:220 stop:2526 length:2307 start_codon:yes stop_codon:yes gene_type:complete
MKKDEAIKIVKKNYNKYQSLPKRFRDNIEIKDVAFKSGIKQLDGLDLEYLAYYLLDSEENNDKYLTLRIAECTKNNIVYLTKISDELKQDKDFFLDLYKVRPENFGWGYLEYASENLRNDPEIALKAVETFSQDFQHVGSKLLKDKEFLAKAINANHELIHNFIYTKDVLSDRKFNDSLDKENKTFVKEFFKDNLDESFLDELDDSNLEPLAQEEYYFFLLGVCQLFFLSEDPHDEPFKKLTADLRAKLIFFLGRVDFFNWHMLSEIPPKLLKIDEHNPSVSTALKNYNNPSAFLGYWHKILIHKTKYKLYQIGIELLASSSFFEDSKMSRWDRELEIASSAITKNWPEFKDITDQIDLIKEPDKATARWKKYLATSCLSKTALCSCLVGDDKGSSIDMYHEYFLLIRLIRHRFESNKIIYDLKHDTIEGFKDGGVDDAYIVDGVAINNIFFSPDNISLNKFTKINAHFKQTIELIETTNNKNAANSLNTFLNMLLQRYGLAPFLPNNKIEMDYGNMINFIAFESKGNLDQDFTTFLKKEKKWFAGIKNDEFKLEEFKFDDEESSEEGQLAPKKESKLSDGHEELNGGVIQKIDFKDLWNEINFEVVLPVDDKYVNESNEFLFASNENSMLLLMFYIKFYKDINAKVQQDKSVSLIPSEANRFYKGKKYGINLLGPLGQDQGDNIRLLEESTELTSARNAKLLNAEITTQLKMIESIEDISAYKFADSLQTIDMNAYRNIINVFIIKYNDGNCEALCIPYRGNNPNLF